MVGTSVNISGDQSPCSAHRSASWHPSTCRFDTPQLSREHRSRLTSPQAITAQAIHRPRSAQATAAAPLLANDRSRRRMAHLNRGYGSYIHKPEVAYQESSQPWARSYIRTRDLPPQQPSSRLSGLEALARPPTPKYSLSTCISSRSYHLLCAVE